MYVCFAFASILGCLISGCLLVRENSPAVNLISFIWFLLLARAENWRKHTIHDDNDSRVGQRDEEEGNH